MIKGRWGTDGLVMLACFEVNTPYWHKRIVRLIKRYGRGYGVREGWVCMTKKTYLKHDFLLNRTAVKCMYLSWSCLAILTSPKPAILLNRSLLNRSPHCRMFLPQTQWAKPCYGRLGNKPTEWQTASLYNTYSRTTGSQGTTMRQKYTFRS